MEYPVVSIFTSFDELGTANTDILYFGTFLYLR